MGASEGNEKTDAEDVNEEIQEETPPVVEDEGKKGKKTILCVMNFCNLAGRYLPPGSYILNPEDTIIKQAKDIGPGTVRIHVGEKYKSALDFLKKNVETDKGKEVLKAKNGVLVKGEEI